MGYITPLYQIPQNVDIDATAANQISCKISGDICTGYLINVLDNSDNTQVYTSGFVDKASAPLYNDDTLTHTIPANTLKNGLDYKWNISLYTDQPTLLVLSGHCVTGSTQTNIHLKTVVEGMEHGNFEQVKPGMYLRIGTEMRKITSFSLDTYIAVVEQGFTITPAAGTAYSIYSPYATFKEYYFRARDLPVVSITNVVSQLNSRVYEFTGSYTQQQGVSLKHYQFDLYENSTNNLIFTTGQVRNNNIKLSFDRFANQQRYGIKLICQNQHDTTVETPIHWFTVSYTSLRADIKPYAELNKERNAVLVEWSKVTEILGKATGSYHISDQHLFLQPQAAITYDELNAQPLAIQDNFTAILKTKLPANFAGESIVVVKNAAGQFARLYFDTTANAICFANHKKTATLLSFQPTGTLSNTLGDYIWLFALSNDGAKALYRLIYTFNVLDNFLYSWDTIANLQGTWDMLEKKQQ